MMRTTLAFTAALLCAACAGGGEPLDPRQPPASTRTVDGIEYAADTRVMESFPVQLATSVTVTNRGDAAAVLIFPDGCVVLLRAYPESGTTAVWDQRNNTGCTMALVEVTLEPGASRTFESRTDAAAILGESLPDGRYRLEAYLRPRSGVVTVAAGTVDLAIPR